MTKHLETFAMVVIGPPAKEWMIFDIKLLEGGGIDAGEARRTIVRASGYERLAEKTRR